jgi:hypothetical protein
MGWGYNSMTAPEMTLEEYLFSQRRKKPSKYKAKPIEIDGHRFDSLAEGRRYNELLLMVRSGEISDLRIHPIYELQAAFKRGKQTIRAISYEADFEYQEGGKCITEDVKGVETEAFKIKHKLFLKLYPSKEFRITKP